MIPESSLENFLRRAATRGERSVARARIVLSLLALANILGLAGGLSFLAEGSVKHWIMVITLVLSVLSSLVVHRELHRREMSGFLLDLSGILDGILALVVVGCSVVFPSPTYVAFIALPSSSAFAVVALASGFRLHMRAVVVGAGFAMSSALGLQLYDWFYNPFIRNNITPDDIGAFWVMNAVTVMLAVAMVRRTRTLVREGSDAVLKAERARQRLGVYVSQELVEQALEPDNLQPGGERRTVAVLFSDLRGFTRYAEKLSPERLVSELNDYLDVMIREVRAEGGVVDKYIGDAIMVVYGLPQGRPDDAARAIRTAWRMEQALAVHNAERQQRGLPPLAQGIGIHYGEVVAGNIGTAERLQYTVVGDVVNLASRLEGATKELHTPVLVSEDARNAAEGHDHPPLHSAGPLHVRGRETPLEVYRFS
ncbi:MAG TPA: adenylate/guanylate cyclase domain-containing protein [Myxococcota bacterium]|nr:adenylate/guanylate cyclase domain-containing protein [Myxococcota bacterium]